MRLLIKNGIVIDPKNNISGKCDILVEDGKICKVGEIDDTEAREFIDAEGKYVIPGLIDAHCHLRDPGYEYKEDLETGSASAAKGGFTSIACMPNTNPVIDNEAVVSYILNKAAQEAYVNIYPIGSISKGLKGEELAEIGELKFAGVVAVSDDGRPVMSSSLMKKALQYSAMFDVMVISHCEDLDLTEDGVMNEGFHSAYIGLKGIPSAAEEVMVARDLILAEYTGTPIHIAHVSTKLSVDLVRNAKKRGVKVTCETCPHYFTLTEEAVGEYNTLAKVNPPLRTKEDVIAIIEGLQEGVIDIIATDHAPHHTDEKNVEFAQAASGFVGFETALPLAITYLVKPGYLTMEKLVQKMCLNPASMLGLNKGSFDEGRSADITIIDIDEEIIVDISKFASKSKNSPFDNYKLFGAVYYTIVNGNAVVREKILI